MRRERNVKSGELDRGNKGDPYNGATAQSAIPYKPYYPRSPYYPYNIIIEVIRHHPTPHIKRQSVRLFLGKQEAECAAYSNVCEQLNPYAV